MLPSVGEGFQPSLASKHPQQERCSIREASGKNERLQVVKLRAGWKPAPTTGEVIETIIYSSTVTERNQDALDNCQGA